MAYIDNVNNIQGFKAICGFGNTLICNDSINDDKTVVFPEGYDDDYNLSFKVVFINGHNCIDDQSHITLNDIPIVINDNGSYIPLPIYYIDSVYKCLQPNTVLELYYANDYDGDGNDAFVVVGNPIVLSGNSYNICANGEINKKTEFYVTETSNISTTSKTFILNNDDFGIKQGDVIKVTFTNPLQTSNTNGILNFDISCYGVTGSVVTKNPMSNVTTNPTAEYKYMVSHTFTNGNYDVNYPNKVFDANTTLELTWTGTYWLASSDVVLCSFTDSSNGYTIYADGLIEQWGIDDLVTNDYFEIDFLIPFDSIKYIATATPSSEANVAPSSSDTWCLINQHEDYVTFMWHNQRNKGWIVNWNIKGY